LRRASENDPLGKLAGEERAALVGRLRESLGLPEGAEVTFAPTHDRDALRFAVRDCDEFLARAVDGKPAAFAGTGAGKRVKQLREAAAKAFGQQAQAAWAALEKRLEPTGAADPSPATLQQLDRAYAAFPLKDWRLPSSSIRVERGGRWVALDDALRARRTEIRTLRADASLKHLRAGEAAIRKLDLNTASSEASAAGALLTEAHAALRARVALVDAQVGLFKSLASEEVEVGLAMDARVGDAQEPYFKVRPLRGAKGTVYCARTETTVETYALFLRFVKALRQAPEMAAGVKLFHPDQPPSFNHMPLGWAGQQEHPRRPVTGVTWFSAWACARWAGRRLPQADEWEVLARGPGGLVSRKHVWDACLQDKGLPADTVLDAGAAGERNDHGLDDTAGNVSEWTATEYQAYMRPLVGERKAKAFAGQYFYCGPNVQTPDDKRAHQLCRWNWGKTSERKPTLGFRMIRDLEER
jgi:hypothetical protein